MKISRYNQIQISRILDIKLDKQSSNEIEFIAKKSEEPFVIARELCEFFKKDYETYKCELVKTLL